MKPTTDFVYNVVKVIAGILALIGIIANFIISISLLVVIKLLYRLVYSRPFNILWGFDALMQYQGSTVFTPDECSSLIQFVVQFQGSADVLKLRKRFQRNILQTGSSDPCSKYYMYYTRRIVRKLGYYIWEDDPHFSIEDHIRLHSQTYDDERSLTKVINHMYHQALPKDHSPWEILLIPKQEINNRASAESNEYTMVVRLHHSLADGTLVILTSASLTDDSCKQSFSDLRKLYSANPEKLSPIVKHNPVVRYLVKRKNGYKLTTDVILSMIANILHGCISLPRLMIENVIHRERNALHGPQLVGRKILGLSEKLELQMFKEIAVAFKCSINDILTYCIVNAFIKEDPTAPSVRIFTAVGGFMPGTVGTQNSNTFFGFDVHLRDESNLDRLRQISETLTRCKASSFLLAQIGVVLLTANHLPHLYAKSRFASYDATIDITNLIGPPLAIYINGDKVTDVVIYPSNFGKTGGITFSCFSYSGKLRLGLVIDRAVAPDDLIADRLMSNVVEQLKFLHESISSQR